MNIKNTIVVAVILGIFWFGFISGETDKAQVKPVVTSNVPPVQSRPQGLPPVIQDQFERTSYPLSDDDEHCMALNIYWEARDQDVKGKLAIGFVTMQRVMSKHYPTDVCGVVWQKNRDKRTGKYVAQFSWTLDGNPDIPKNKKAWEEAQLVASTFAAGSVIEDFTNGSYLYHADYVSPYWKTSYKLQTKIGSHLFYK